MTLKQAIQEEWKETHVELCIVFFASMAVGLLCGWLTHSALVGFSAALLANPVLKIYRIK